MRPIRLTMEGFGPYKDRTVIDMDALGTGGIYLVTGDTGAGKTFIFDAITYALYGETSGGSRDSRTLRSQYADDDDETYVELLFEYAGRRYTVRRSPEYNRKKKRGEGYTRESATAVLTYDDGSVVDGPSKVGEAVRDLLGIDRGQFCNIVMIAQGEFRKLLNAGTDERQRLFRKLFNTMPYNDLADELKAASKAIDDEYDSKRKEIDLALSGLSCSFDEEISATLSELKEAENTSADEISERLESMIGYCRSKLEETSSELAETEEILTDANSKLAVIDSYRQSVRDLETARSNVDKLEDAIKTAEFELQLANEEKPAIEELRSEAAVLESGLDSYNALDEINEELSRALEDQQDKRSALKKLKEERNEARKSLEDMKADLDDLKYSDEHMTKIKNDIEKTGNRISMLEALVSEIDKVKELRAVLSSQQEELIPLTERAEELEAEYSKAYSDFLRGQAGLLAARLQEGRPCPVCGSYRHPDPAEASREILSAEDIEDKSREAKQARELAVAKSGEAQKTKGSLNAVEFSAKEIALKETGFDDLDKALDKARSETEEFRGNIEKLRQTEKELEERIAKKSELEESVKKAEAELEELSNTVIDADKEMVRIDSSVNSLKDKRDTTARELRFAGRREAEDHIAGIREKADAKQKAIEDAEGSIVKAREQKTANDASIGELEKVVADVIPMDEIEVRERKAEAEERKAALTELSTALNTDIVNAGNTLELVRRNAAGLEEVRKRHEVVDSLVRTATGSLPGKERISLETYVQAFYFDRIIRRANIRLRMMSGGQYEFARAEESGDRRARFGLDLSVIDHYSGTSRPVNTLSGGESFLASLSLALGMSDEVQASAGGIRLDTMFVDEGFGSLDSETLEKAIRTLTELSDEDRLVGIISHVEALKSRIDRQIVVTKDKSSGSRVTVIS